MFINHITFACINSLSADVEYTPHDTVVISDSCKHVDTY